MLSFDPAPSKHPTKTVTSPHSRLGLPTDRPTYLQHRSSNNNNDQACLRWSEVVGVFTWPRLLPPTQKVIHSKSWSQHQFSGSVGVIASSRRRRGRQQQRSHSHTQLVWLGSPPSRRAWWSPQPGRRKPTDVHNNRRDPRARSHHQRQRSRESWVG